MSREGSGRVAVLKATGLVRSYTLECNYNTGRLVNVLPPTAREGPAAAPPAAPLPPKYTPHIFEEVNPFQVCGHWRLTTCSNCVTTTTPNDVLPLASRAGPVALAVPPK